jgi:hypothetical protein
MALFSSLYAGLGFETNPRIDGKVTTR